MVAALCLPQIRCDVALLGCVCAGQSFEGDPPHLRGDIGWRDAKMSHEQIAWDIRAKPSKKPPATVSSVEQTRLLRPPCWCIHSTRSETHKWRFARAAWSRKADPARGPCSKMSKSLGTSMQNRRKSHQQPCRAWNKLDCCARTSSNLEFQCMYGRLPRDRHRSSTLLVHHTRRKTPK